MKIVCGRSDCAYEYSSRCTLKQIAVGKDFKCHSYKCSYDSDAVELFEKSIEKMDPCIKIDMTGDEGEQLNKIKQESVFRAVPMRGGK